jgi:hypothetical protein
MRAEITDDMQSTATSTPKAGVSIVALTRPATMLLQQDSQICDFLKTWVVFLGDLLPDLPYFLHGCKSMARSANHGYAREQFGTSTDLRQLRFAGGKLRLPVLAP